MEQSTFEVVIYFGALIGCLLFMAIVLSPIDSTSRSSTDGESVYDGQGTTSVPSYNRSGNLVYPGNSSSSPAYNIEGDRIYEGSFSGAPVATIIGDKVYRGQGADGIPIGTIVGDRIYPGNASSGVPLGASPGGGKHLLALRNGKG
jgi:hypothetical protein